MLTNKQKQTGFTIVELLIVIIVIAILVTLVITAYSNVQAKARDTKRLSDAKAITKALQLYALENGNVLQKSFSGSGSWHTGWEASHYEAPGEFLKPLGPYGLNNNVPLDPVNNENYNYFYSNYAAGSYGCDSARGNFYVFAVYHFETMSASQIESPGFSCADRNWSSGGAYVVGGYTD